MFDEPAPVNCDHLAHLINIVSAQLSPTKRGKVFESVETLINQIPDIVTDVMATLGDITDHDLDNVGEKVRIVLDNISIIAQVANIHDAPNNTRDTLEMRGETDQE